MRNIFMRYPGGLAKAVTFSYDDGVEQDKRLSDLFYRYGLKATFNHNGRRLGPEAFTPEELEEYIFSRGHELAVHGEMHRPTGNLRPIDGIREVLNCRLELEEKSGRIIRGFAYPATGIRLMGNLGSYGAVKQYLTELDIAYARTLGEDNNSFMLPADFHAWMPTAHHKNPKLLEYIDEFLALDLAFGHIYHPRRMPRLLYIWGHSYEFDTDQSWDYMEEVCRRLAGRDDLYYATNIEICEYTEAYLRLVFSADSRRVKNPTATDIFIDVDGRAFCIKAGETVVIEE